MRIPFFSNLETRSDSYGDAITELIQGRASGAAAAKPHATAALEACAGFVSRAFASADVQGGPMAAAALTPETLGMIGRALIRSGEIAFRIDVADGALRLVPAQSWDVQGTPTSWRYQLVLGGPSETLTTSDYLPAAAVVHCRYAVDPERPWKGNGPLEVAALAGKLSAETTRQLGEESSGSAGGVLPIPIDGQDPTVDALRKDIGSLKGKTALVQGGDWGNAGSGGMATWKRLRIGAEPPAPLVQLQEIATGEVYAACGINPALFRDSQGTAGREAYRQALHSVVAPLGRLVVTELRDKLDDPTIDLSWEELRAGDIAGRARAFQSMVGAGMEAGKAAALSGLVMEEASA